MLPPAFSRIINDAHTLQHLTSCSGLRVQNKPTHVRRTVTTPERIQGKSRSDFSLPPPSPISNLLLDQGVPADAAEALSQAFIRTGSQLQRRTNLALSSSITLECDETTSRQIYSVFLKMYQQTLKDWENKTVRTAVARFHENTQVVKDSHIVAVTTPCVTLPDKNVEKLQTKPSISCGFDQDCSLTGKVETHKYYSSLTHPQTPPHAFPTIYPPPMESKPPVVCNPLPIRLPEWRPPSSPSLTSNTKEFDIDSLSKLFSTKLVIRENVVHDVKRLTSVHAQKVFRSSSVTIDSANTELRPSPCIPTSPRNLSSQQTLKSSRHTKSQNKKQTVQPRRMPPSRDVSPMEEQIIPGCSSQLRTSDPLCVPPPAVSLDVENPTTFTISNKISGFLRQPVSPSLDVTSPAAVPRIFLKTPSNLSSRLASAISQTLPPKSKSRKIVSLPRRMLHSITETTQIPSRSSSTLSRTPSLSSISSCDSSSNQGPVTPPSDHSELPSMFQERLDSLDDSYLTLFPGTLAETNKPSENLTGCAIDGLEHQALG